MSAPEPARLPATGTHRAFASHGRDTGPAAPAALDAAGDDDEARGLNRFSIARIYTTFQLKRAEHFAAELDEAAFDLLVDLYLYDWLGRRAGAQRRGGMRLESGALPAGVLSLVEAGLAVVTCGSRPGEAATINLSRAGRARLQSYFDDMASYISAI